MWHRTTFPVTVSTTPYMHASTQAHGRAVGRHFGGGGDTTTAATVRVPIEVPGTGAGGEGRTWLSFRGPRGTQARPAHVH